MPTVTVVATSIKALPPCITEFGLRRIRVSPRKLEGRLLCAQRRSPVSQCPPECVSCPQAFWPFRQPPVCPGSRVGSGVRTLYALVAHFVSFVCLYVLRIGPTSRFARSGRERTRCRSQWSQSFAASLCSFIPLNCRLTNQPMTDRDPALPGALAHSAHDICARVLLLANRLVSHNGGTTRDYLPTYALICELY